jgi:hypothetical protein
MKILIARLNHETNTFSPVPTPLAAFGPDGPTFGAQAYKDNKGMRTAMSAFIDLAEQAGADGGHAGVGLGQPERAGRCAGLHHAHAMHRRRGTGLRCHPARPARRDGGAEQRGRRGRPAGAPARRGAGRAHWRGAGPARQRDAGRWCENADVIVGFKTYPHIDMYETGAHAGRLLLDLLAGRRGRTCAGASCR